jgi:multiple sugar transport system permease protein
MRLTNNLRRDIGGWALMLPTLALFAFFIWSPLIQSVILSFSSVKGTTITGFAGLANYRSLFVAPNFATSWLNTLQYILWSLALGFFVPMFMAVMITESPILKGMTRVVMYLPNIIPGVAVAMIWLFFYKSGSHGVLNMLGGYVGLEPFNWVTQKGWTIPLIILMMTWKSAGATALIYMAGITGISGDIVEAATIDGAGAFKRFFHIVLPNLMGLAKTMLILQIISVFQILYEPMMLNGTYESKVSVMMIVYRFTQEEVRYGIAAAASVLICIALGVLTIAYFALTRKVAND